MNKLLQKHIVLSQHKLTLQDPSKCQFNRIKRITTQLQEIWNFVFRLKHIVYYGIYAQYGDTGFPNLTCVAN